MVPEVFLYFSSRTGEHESRGVFATRVRSCCSLIPSGEKSRKTSGTRVKGRLMCIFLCSNRVQISSGTDVLFCHDPLSHLAIDASSCMKV